jgi:hypothetical protein
VEAAEEAAVAVGEGDWATREVARTIVRLRLRT